MGTDKIKIKGANYTAIDTGDGYFTLKDFPLMSEVKKGTKGAPKDVTETEIKEFVEKRGCLSEAAYADLVALCHFLPGPASSQIGMAIGMRIFVKICRVLAPKERASAILARSTRRKPVAELIITIGPLASATAMMRGSLPKPKPLLSELLF